MIKRLLIANRGEIACRIIRSAKKAGIICIAIYSEADKKSRHVALSDEAYALRGSTAQESYLDQTQILDIAKKYAVDAIHPGYGFLSENSTFAQACVDHQIIFVGPSPEAIALMGSKKTAKERIESIKIPTIPGFNPGTETIDAIAARCESMTFPILIKAAAGGGGKGMRIVNDSHTLEQAIQEAKREAIASFNDETLIIEKYLASPRHIECQIFADLHGNVVHLFERDCSIQRRYQKIIEEAPAEHLSTDLKKTLYDYSIRIAEAIDYCGAGTIEYLVDGDAIYFMEMNTRLQVEHPVTEMITGIDLVEWQLLVANGHELPRTQSEINCNGCAIEARLYAEDPYDNFKPQLGRIEHLQFPENNPSLRIEHGLQTGDMITPYYDPMIAKIVAHAETREKARQTLAKTLSHSITIGLNNNANFLNTVITQDDFISANYSTHFIEQHLEPITFKPPLNTLIAASLYFYLKKRSPLAYFRLNQASQSQSTFTCLNELIEYQIIQDHDDYHLRINQGDKHLISDPEVSTHHLHFTFENQRHTFAFITTKDTAVTLYGSFPALTFARQEATLIDTSDEAQHAVAPMPGTVAAVLAKEKTTVTQGTGIIVIEAMKMQHTLTAAYDGYLKQIYYEVGDQVLEGDTLYELETKT